jgi:hypothetical protein
MATMLAQIWQEIDASRHPCHWWQHSQRRRITAMALLIFILMAAALTGVGWAALYLHEYVNNDGYGRPSAQHAPPRSHPRDPFEPRFV